MDTPYISDKSLINVIDTITTRAYRRQDATLATSFENDPNITFAITTPAGTDLNTTKRAFTWFIRQKAATIGARLEEARNLTRADGAERTVDVSDLGAKADWPQLTVTVQSAEAAAVA
jgi:hypothetical protein